MREDALPIREIMLARMKRIVIVATAIVVVVCSVTSWLDIRNIEINQSKVIFDQVNSILDENVVAAVERVSTEGEEGASSTRSAEDVARATLPAIFHIIGAGDSGDLCYIDPSANTVVVSTAWDESNVSLDSVGLSADQVRGGSNGFFAYIRGDLWYCVSSPRGDNLLMSLTDGYLLLASLLLRTIIVVVLCLGLMFVFIKTILDEMNKTVIVPIQDINESLKPILERNYETRVASQSSREFSDFANYVNEMAFSVQEHVSTVHYQSRHDVLTGARNQNSLQLTLGHLRQSGGTVGIVFADLNELKRINDEMGHDAGDRLIVELANLLFEVFGKNCVYRAGGDEFVVIDTELSREELQRKTETFVKQHSVGGCSVSVGSSFCEDARNVDQYIVEADAAMYAMKREYYRTSSSHGDLALGDGKAAFTQQVMKRLTGGLQDDSAELAVEESKSGPHVRVDGKELWMIRLEEMFKAFSMIADESYVFLCDLEHDYSIWSRNAVDTFGLPGQYMEHASEIWEAHIHPDDRDDYHRSIELIFGGEVNFHDMQYRARERGGRYDICTCRGLVLTDDQGEPKYFGGSIKNNTLEGRVDSLTGLMNQEGFFEALKGLIRNRREAVILMIGPSDFSEVNSLYGYEFGNMVIHQMARHCASEFSNLGDFFRLDGTQSILISNDVPVEMLQEKYRQLRQWMLAEFEVEGQQIPLRLNGAIIKLDDFDIDDNTVFVCLNSAFQTSKREKGGELVYFQDYGSGDSRHALKTINALRLSLARGFEGFRLLYQPIVDATTEQFCGAEVLLRWSNEDFGEVHPDEFIPVLENDTRFYSLGLWILRQAMCDGLPLIKNNPNFLLHANLSYAQMQIPYFAQDIVRLLESVGYPAENLCLEVTERCRLVDKRRIANFIASLKAYGVRFALDDFGTGYSSANILRELDFDVVKIDKSFVRDIESDDCAQRALANFVDLAQIYGAQTCVEGVETAGMRDVLRAYPVDAMQGYYYSAPVPISHLV